MKILLLLYIMVSLYSVIFFLWLEHLFLTAVLENTGENTVVRTTNIFILFFFRTILILSVVYGIGNIVVSISAVPFDNLNGINM